MSKVKLKHTVDFRNILIVYQTYFSLLKNLNGHVFRGLFLNNALMYATFLGHF